MIQHDESLNAQALVPLQRENERVTKENNKLHHDIILIKEERDNCELKWKSALRQLQEECQDLKFLVDTKDNRIRKLDQNVTALKVQMQKHLEKIYHPGADKIVDGLSQFNDRSATNMLGAHEQAIEQTHLLQKDIHQNDPNSAIHAGLMAQDGQLIDQNQWAHEVRRADERCEQYQNIVNDLQHKLNAEQEYVQDLTGKIKVRDQEILRLHELYQPAQNLEKLNLKFQYEQNENSVKKLQNQVDFLNRENDKL